MSDQWKSGDPPPPGMKLQFLRMPEGTPTWAPLTPADMTMRDHFATAAMEAMLSQRCFPWDKNTPLCAYEIADAMLKARAA